MVAIATIALLGTGAAFLFTVAVLWGVAGPLLTAALVIPYAGIMYALWRRGVSRL